MTENICNGCESMFVEIDSENIFTPEDFTDEQRQIAETTEQFVMRIRTDLWFTPSSIECICNEVKEMIAGRSDISYFGSDWINENAGVKNNRLPVHIDFDTVIQDFVVLANRDKLKPKDQCIDDIKS